MQTSVVMATYNGESFIAEQLRSILEQDCPPTQIVVSDDHSRDRTLDVVQEIRAGDPARFVVQENPNARGYTNNFKAALARASGEIVFFCDQDDIWRADKIRLMVEAFERSDALLICHDFEVFFDDPAATIPSYFANLDANGQIGRAHV